MRGRESLEARLMDGLVLAPVSGGSSWVTRWPAAGWNRLNPSGCVNQWWRWATCDGAALLLFCHSINESILCLVQDAHLGQERKRTPRTTSASSTTLHVEAKSLQLGQNSLLRAMPPFWGCFIGEHIYFCNRQELSATLAEASWGHFKMRLCPFLCWNIPLNLCLPWQLRSRESIHQRGNHSGEVARQGRCVCVCVYWGQLSVILRVASSDLCKFKDFIDRWGGLNQSRSSPSTLGD